jgi:hypothetical protein
MELSFKWTKDGTDFQGVYNFQAGSMVHSFDLMDRVTATEDRGFLRVFPSVFTYIVPMVKGLSRSLNRKSKLQQDIQFC